MESLPPNVTQLRSVRVPEAGSGYTEEEFRAFWNELDPEDRVEFQMTYGGNKQLAAFVFLLDKWMISGGKWNRPDFGMIVEAYAISHSTESVRIPLTTAREKYREALEHPSVKSLLSRLTYRENFSAIIRIQHKHNKLVEDLVDKAQSEMTEVLDEQGERVRGGIMTGEGGNLPIIALAIKSAQGMMSSVAQREASERAERTKGAMAKARKAAQEAAERSGVAHSDDEIVVGMRELRSKLGDDRFEQLLAASRLQELGS